jgi:hypothetical protein
LVNPLIIGESTVLPLAAPARLLPWPLCRRPRMNEEVGVIVVVWVLTPESGPTASLAPLQ